MRIKVYLEDAGCDRRRLDMRTIRAYLQANEYELVGDPAQADKIILSTCAFKQKEEDESVRRLRSLRKYGDKVVVYGCLPDIASQRYVEFEDIPFVSPRELESISGHFAGTQVPFGEVGEAHVLEREFPDLGRAKRRIEVGLPARAEMLHQARVRGPERLRDLLRGTKSEPFYLFVCRGCRGQCSYCAIRQPIGRLESKPIRAVVADLERGLAEGFRDFVILGDDPGCYGLDIGVTLPQLMGALFDASDVVESQVDRANGHGPIGFQIREIHPKYLVEYYQSMIALPGFGRVEEILCPVQSGSDRVLGLMRREHSAGDFSQAIQAIRRDRPDMRLSTQIIVGFPTETTEDFQSTLDLVVDGEFDSVVVFPYHDKMGSHSSEIDGKVPQTEIDHRMRYAFRHFREQRVRAYYTCP